MTDDELEEESLKEFCYTCIHFYSLMGEAGLCKIAENNCMCKNPKAMIDIFNKKCDKWEYHVKT